MKKYFILYKPFLLFLGTFFLTYIVLTFLYQQYLNGFEENQIDSVTRMVSENTEQVLLLFTDGSSIEESTTQPYMKLFFNEKYVARIVEGCNSISVIILFISFVVAFSGRLQTTLLFIFGGSLLIYALNVLRIAALSALIFYFPKQESLLHEVLFPLYIYGVVFILWLIWVRKFSRYASKDSK
ncbi:exosortase family protein XrtF [Flavobacterium sinopsychrotolerans]|uniref:Exosortase family protein XrtF n=1 Tax=Flavobacterium sinopsychrotolerans TaxID=604089 RepID=A0A1H8IAX6_9FLAO|nr:exosortase family protein XrtF [Flavobacterium sinopsychrotolerans]SEN65584.1 exosortase family protein XrtF [Flavobacterium sinopsychrotolerans]